MLSHSQLKDQINTTESIKMITQALGDIATIKLKANKASREQNIVYFQDIARIYRIVKSIALKKQATKKLPLNKPDRLVCILLTANSHFYGGLDSELTRFFIDNTTKLNCNRIVVGSFAQDYLRQVNYHLPFAAITFQKDSPTLAELKNLSQQVFSYRQILVFHTKFVTLLNQVPYISDVSASYSDNPKLKIPFHYIAEPEINKILDFFDSQLSFLMFQAIFLEVDYARLAARMVAMNQAEENADKVLAGQKRQLDTLRKQFLNLQILETYAGLLKRYEH